MRSGQDGFTLPEVMIAGMIGLCLALPAYALLTNTYRTSALIGSRFARDTQARQVVSLLGDGTATASTVDIRGFTLIEGLRSRQTLPASGSLDSGGEFILTEAAASGGTLAAYGDKVSSISVACEKPQTPLPGCSGAGTQVTTIGWLGTAPSIVSLPVTPPMGNGAPTGAVAAVDVTISDPFEATRPGQRASDVSDTYRTMFTLNVQGTP